MSFKSYKRQSKRNDGLVLLIKIKSFYGMQRVHQGIMQRKKEHNITFFHTSLYGFDRDGQ